MLVHSMYSYNEDDAIYGVIRLDACLVMDTV